MKVHRNTNGYIQILAVGRLIKESFGIPHNQLRNAVNQVYAVPQKRVKRERSMRGTPGTRSSMGTGSPNWPCRGTTPAHVGRRISPSSSTGGPLRTLAETSSRGRASTVVGFSSWSEGWRTSSQRLGRMWLVKQRRGAGLDR